MKSRRHCWVLLCLTLSACRTAAPVTEEPSEPVAAEDVSDIATPESVAPPAEEPEPKPPKFRITKDAAYWGDWQIYEDVEIREEPDEDGCESYDSTSFGAVSRVGTVFSYYESSSSEAGCGYPSSSSTNHTVNLSEGPATLDLLVRSDDVLEALKASPHFRETIANATTVNEAVEALQAKEIYFDYAFIEMNEDKTQVLMRLLYVLDDEDGCMGFSCPDLSEILDIWVTPRPEHMESFLRAADGSDGFLRSNRPEFDE